MNRTQDSPSEVPLLSATPGDAATPSGPARVRDAPSATIRAVRAIEFVFLFFGLPSLAAFGPYQIRVIPMLVTLGGICAIALVVSPGFDRSRLLNLAGARKAARYVCLRFLILGVLLLATTAVWDLVETDRSILFGLPRRDAGLWMTIMVLYPVFSVYPQELIYRAFVFHRYKPVFGGGGAMIAASALAFGYGHIIFPDWPSVALTVLGGLLFASTYARTRSLAASWLEHALYGDLVFTIGMGSLFYLVPGGG